MLAHTFNLAVFPSLQFTFAPTTTISKNKKQKIKIAEEGFLEYINNILTIGMVPALFSDDERETIIGQCRTVATEAGYSASK